MQFRAQLSNTALSSRTAVHLPQNSVAISDTLPTQTTGTAGTGFLNGTYTGTPGSGTCNADGTAGGTITATSASGNLGTVAAGATSTFYFRVTIN